MKTINTLLTVAVMLAMLAPLILAAAKFGGQIKPGRTALASMRRAFGFRGGVIAVNTTEKEKVRMLFAPALEIAMNAETLPEWIQLAPYGEHPTRDKKRVQVFNAESAAQVVTWFDFWPRKITRVMGVNACPVWVGHPDFDSATWPERRRIGSILELDAREDGLWGKIEWNASAEKALREEGHKFPSVAWDCDEINAEQITPVMLWSVGMWHKPNIKSVQSVINADGEMEEDDTEDEKVKGGKPGTLMDSIMGVLRTGGIVKDGDSEDSILAAVGNLISSLAYSRQEKARRDEETLRLRTALNAGEEKADDILLDEALTEINAGRSLIETNAARISELEAEVVQLNAARVSEAVNRLIETGRITKADEEAVTAELNANFEEAMSKRLAAPLQLNSAKIQIGGAKPAVMAATERAAKLQMEVNAHMDKTGCDYDAAWEWSKTNDTTKGLHEAMKAEDEARQA
jgi:hypothetical protein